MPHSGRRWWESVQEEEGPIDPGTRILQQRRIAPNFKTMRRWQIDLEV